MKVVTEVTRAIWDLTSSQSVKYDVAEISRLLELLETNLSHLTERGQVEMVGSLASLWMPRPAGRESIAGAPAFNTPVYNAREVVCLAMRQVG